MNIKEVTPYNTQEDKTTQLYKMFNSISRKYDKFNDIMSLGLAHKWRNKALKSLKPYNHNQILDLACGTADICIKAFSLLTPEHVTGVDISEGMMEVGRMKINAVKLNDKITLQKEDVSSMSFADETFDAATTAFGIRNFDKLDESILEVHRVLKPQGKFVILEMREPKTPIIHLSYLLYTRTLIPLAVKTFSNDPLAYKYLTDSMKVFPQGKEMIAILEKNGFKCLKHKTFFLGVCSLYLVEKV